MTNPLIPFKQLIRKSFYTDTKARLDEYVEYMNAYYTSEVIEKKINNVKGYYLISHEGADIFIKSSDIYIVECYEQIEWQVKKAINEEANLLDRDKTEIFIRDLISNLEVTKGVIYALDLDKKLTIFRNKVVEKLQAFISYLQETYIITPASITRTTPKIQWLGKTNVLATLIFDLWQGQDKIKQPSTISLIKAQKKDLEALLINNFLDEKGKPLTESTISDYLNKSKPEKRAKKGIRIELEY